MPIQPEGAVLAKGVMGDLLDRGRKQQLSMVLTNPHQAIFVGDLPCAMHFFMPPEGGLLTMHVEARRIFL